MYRDHHSVAAITGDITRGHACSFVRDRSAFEFHRVAGQHQPAARLKSFPSWCLLLTFFPWSAWCELVELLSTHHELQRRALRVLADPMAATVAGTC